MTTHAPEAACPIDEKFDPLSPEFLADPYAVIAALPLAAERPVFFAPSIGYYVIMRHADIEQVFREPGTYSAAVAQAPLAPLVPEAQQILLPAGTSRSRRWSAWMSPSMRGCASPPPAPSA